MFKFAFIWVAALLVWCRGQTYPTPRPTSAPTMACQCTRYTYDSWSSNGTSSDVVNYDTTTGYGTGCSRCPSDVAADCSQSDLTTCTCPTQADCDLYNAVAGVVGAVAAAFLCCCICIILAVTLPTVGIVIGVIICCVQQNKRRPVQQQVVMTTTTQAAPPTDGPATATTQAPVQYVDQNGNPIQVIQQ